MDDKQESNEIRIDLNEVDDSTLTQIQKYLQNANL